jgi:hypothetical protein
MRRALPPLGLLALVCCTDADIYTATGADPFRPDRIAVTGRLCTEDTTGPKFPVKTLIIVDTSQAMFAADPDMYRFDGPGSQPAPGSLAAFIAMNRMQQNSFLGFAGLSSVAKPVQPTVLCNPLPCNPQQYFPAADISDGGMVQAGMVMAGGQRDLENAVSQAESFITADMARSSAGEVLRTRYIVYMLLAGPPTGATSGTQFDELVTSLSEQVLRLKELVYSRGALEFRLSIGYLYFGPRTVQQSPPVGTGYGCGFGGGTVAPCSCGGTCGSGTTTFCGVCCDIQTPPGPPFSNWDTWNDRARRAYSAMAFAGDGLFREFECPAAIQFRLDAATSAVRLKRKDIVAYNINTRLGEEEPVLDSDGDGLLDDEELTATPATSPVNWDTDGDGISDRLEFRAYPRQNPMDPTDRPSACPDPALIRLIPDRDLDMLNDCEEGLLQTSASIPDTDGDGLPDALEFMSGTVPTSAEDRLLDFDGDGIANAEEVLEHTNPRTNDGRLRGSEGYRTNIVDLGPRTVATMEDRVELRAVSFRSASPTVAGGAGLLRYTPSNPPVLEWCDANYGILPFEPVPLELDETGIYTLYCENPNTQEQVSVEVFVVVEWLPETTVNSCSVTADCEPDWTCHTPPTGSSHCVIETRPHISTSERSCYDVRISNIRLMQALEAEDVLHDGSNHPLGTNHILVFFTQAPEDRLDSPGIAKVAELTVTFRCTDPENVDTCVRVPEAGFVELTDADFASSVP